LRAQESAVKDKYNEDLAKIRLQQAQFGTSAYDRQAAARDRQNRYLYSNSALTQAYLRRRSMYDSYASLKEEATIGAGKAKADQDLYKAEMDKYYDQDGKLKPGVNEHDANMAKFGYSTATENLKKYNRQLEDANEGMKRFSGFGNLVGTSLEAMNKTLDHTIRMFSHRFFMAAIREATQFVKQYDASMRQIQAITYKTDEEMASIRSDTIDKAIELKTSATNVAEVEASLYRQGLGDAEVRERTDAIIKF